MSDEIPLDSSSFNKNYKVLKETADWLSTSRRSQTSTSLSEG